MCGWRVRAYLRCCVFDVLLGRHVVGMVLRKAVILVSYVMCSVVAQEGCFGGIVSIYAMIPLLSSHGAVSQWCCAVVFGIAVWIVV